MYYTGMAIPIKLINTNYRNIERSQQKATKVARGVWWDYNEQNRCVDRKRKKYVNGKEEYITAWQTYFNRYALL